MTAPGSMNATEKCHYYARFLSHLDRPHFDTLYWTLFVAVIALLFVSSSIYSWAIDFKRENEKRKEKSQKEASYAIEAELVDCDKIAKRRIKLSLFLCGVVFIATVLVCIVEVYALMALQFCDGEDLMALFWAMWTMLQLGSSVACLGIVLALIHTLCDVKAPMWALALGTPVLVVAGMGHLMKWMLRRFYRRARKEVREVKRLSSRSRSPRSGNETETRSRTPERVAPSGRRTSR